MFVTFPKQVSGVGYCSIHELKYSCQEPPALQPDSNLRTPCNVAVLIFVAFFLCAFHVVGKFIVPLIDQEKEVRI